MSLKCRKTVYERVFRQDHPNSELFGIAISTFGYTFYLNSEQGAQEGVKRGVCNSEVCYFVKVLGEIEEKQLDEQKMIANYKRDHPLVVDDGSDFDKDNKHNKCKHLGAKEHMYFVMRVVAITVLVCIVVIAVINLIVFCVNMQTIQKLNLYSYTSFTKKK